ncbi:MAG: response regulator [Calditrichaeota bacterium]|nr:MAG: response regulator [Calditrichota bacterium]
MEFLNLEDIPEESQQRIYRLQKLSLIGELAGGVMHNLNNVLGGILGFSQILLNDMEPDHRSYYQLSQIEKAALRATRVIQQFFSLINLNYQDEKLIDPKEIIEETVKILRAGLKNNINLEIRYNHESVAIRTDPALIIQVILNVCLFARDAMPFGGTILIETCCRSNNQSGYVIIKIVVNGKNLNFDLHHVNGTENSVLGLTLTRFILKNIGGQLVINSQQNRATGFEIHIPAEMIHEITSTSINKNGNLIMVVDDEEDLRILAKDLFESKGFEVLTARDGETAIETFNKYKESIKVVILDLVLPGIDGGKVYEQITTMGTPEIILTSGHSKNEQIQSIIEKGVAHYMPKPWDIPELLEKTKKLLS